MEKKKKKVIIMWVVEEWLKIEKCYLKGWILISRKKGKVYFMYKMEG